MLVVKVWSSTFADTAVTATGVRCTSTVRRWAVTMTVSRVAPAAPVATAEAASGDWALAAEAAHTPTAKTQVVNIRSRLARFDRLTMAPSFFQTQVRWTERSARVVRNAAGNDLIGENYVVVQTI